MTSTIHWGVESARVVACSKCTLASDSRLLRDEHENVPQPGYVGTRYWTAGVMLVGQNPGVHSLGFGPNNISNLKNGTSPIPLSRVMMLAEALRLSETERFEFMTTRLIELHGEKSELCFSAMAAWAEEVFAPTGAEAALVAMWRRAAAPAPHLGADLLDDPNVAGEISAVIARAAQRRFLQLEEDAKAA